MAKNTGLGKGLGALFNDTVLDEEEEKKELKEGEEVVHKLKLIEIEPNRNQPRRTFNEESLEELAQSIKNYGVIQPIIVAKKDDYYEIIAGERRWRASKRAGLDEIPCIIREETDRNNKEIALIENIQREDLNAVEKARSYKELIEEYGLTNTQLGEAIGKSSGAIGNTMRILNLDEKVLNLIMEGKISEGHARQLLYFEDPAEQLAMAEEIIKKGLSVRDIEKKVRGLRFMKENKVTHKKETKNSAIIQDIENTFQGYFGTKVKLEAGKKSGKIIIEYSSNDDLERIIELLKNK